MPNARAYAATSSTSALEPFRFDRRALRPNDVKIDILFCGVCHSDLHMARNDWGGAVYPCCPGHEIVGRITEVGAEVTAFKAGDLAAVGCLVDSCMECDQCRKGEEQLCRKGATATYNGRDRVTGENTYGGYSDHIVVRQEFVVRIPEGMDLERAAPLLCAGITTYSPLKKWNAGPGTRLAVLGLGGLGHMAVKLGVAMGCEVTVVTSSPSKREDALALGAHKVLLSSENESMHAARSGFDLIIDTIPVGHDLLPYVPLLDIDGTLVIVGAIDVIPPFHSGLLLMGRRRVSGSPIGGIAETQEMLNFCAEMNVLPDCETIRIQDINTAWERMQRSDVKYRFVIDMSSLAAEAAA